MSHSAIYKCLNCSKVRRIIQPELGIDKQNGLRQYSDLHRCSDGVLAINNIQIDTNYSVRSVERLELEEKSKKMNSKLKIPLPKPNKSIFYNNLSISHLKEKDDLRLVFTNELSGRTFTIGDVITSEEPIETFSSFIGGYSVEYYQSTTQLDNSLRKWFVVLISLIELIPPKEIGYFMEALHYLFDMRRVPPCVYDIHMIELILTADQIRLEYGDMGVENISTNEELSGDHYHIINQVLEHMQNNPEDSLLDVCNIIPDDFVFIAFLIQIMENYGVISLIKPPMIDEINTNFIDILID